MRACSKLLTILICLLTCAAASAQQDVASHIASLEPAVKAGTATRDQQLDLARAYVDVGRYYEASVIAKRLLVTNATDPDAIAIRDKAQEQLKIIADQRVLDAEDAAKRSDATDADKLELANAYFNAARYREAIAIYTSLPAETMTFAARHNYARALTWSSRHAEAERVYVKLMEEQPSPELALEYGRVLSWMGASRAAVEKLSTVYETNPTEDAALALANARAWSGEREAAINLLTSYTASHPNSPDATALLQQLQTSPELRLERLDRLIELDPYNLALRVHRAQLLYEAGRDSEALKTVEFINEHAPRGVLTNTAGMVSSTGESVADLENRIRDRRKQKIAELDARIAAMNIKDPANASEVMSLAKAYTGAGAYPQAIRLYDAYLTIAPDDREARTNYARVLSWDRRYDDAAEQYDRLLREDPERADLKLEYAQVMSYDQRYVPAIRTFRQLTDLSENPRGYLYSDVPQQAHYNLGQIYRWYGWRDHAVTEQNAALALESDFMPARDELFRAREGRPSSMLDARYTYATNSNDFTLKRVDLEGSHSLNNRLTVLAGVGRHNFEYRGDEVDANAGSVGATYKQTDRLTFRGRVGATFYEEDLGTRPFWALGAQFLPNIQSRAALDYNRYDLVYDVFTLQSLTPAAGVGTNFGDPISIDDFRGHYDWNGGGLLSFLADASYGFISDDNRRSAAHGLVTFRVWNKPFVALKADGRVLSYDFRTNRYWSPDDYSSLAGVLQIGQNVRDRFFWNVEGKLGKSWENGRTSDLRAIAASLTVPITPMLDIIGNYGYGKSGRFDSITGGDANDFVNYWQRNWFVGIRVKRLYAGDERRNNNSYYFDNRPLTGSSVILPEAQ